MNPKSFNRYVQLVSVGLALVGGYYLFQGVERLAEHHPLRLLGVTLLVAGAAWLFWASRQAKPSADRLWIAPVIILLIWSGCGIQSGHQNRKQIRWYCMYGAVSQAQLNSCVSHVHLSDIYDRGTAAARFAEAQRTRCGFTSGPFCAEARRERELEILRSTGR